MIELLEAGQPVYDVSVTGAGFDEGVELAQTNNDFIQYQMEHGPFDPNRLREFMLGLVRVVPPRAGIEHPPLSSPCRFLASMKPRFASTTGS